MLYNIVGTFVYHNCANFWYSYQYVAMLADAFANFFLLVVTDVMITLAVKNYEDVIMADLFWQMWLIMTIL